MRTPTEREKAIEDRLLGVEILVVKMSDALQALWWSASTEAKARIREVQELANTIRKPHASKETGG